MYRINGEPFTAAYFFLQLIVPNTKRDTGATDNPTEQVNNILRAFKRLKANAADGGKPYKEDSVEFKDNIDGLDILVRYGS